MSIIIPTGAGLSFDAIGAVEDAATVDCETCKSSEFVLTKMQRSNGSWCVDIQCQSCWRSGGHPFPMKDHPKWESYPLFRSGAHHRWRERRWQREKEFRESELADLRMDYAEWLRTSPEWRELRKKIIRRSDGLCEACLEEPGVDVHHLTYEYGRLPPAWLLRYVCRSCHDRFSTVGDEWGSKETP